MARTRRLGDNAGMASDDGRAQVQLDEDTLPCRRRDLGEDHAGTLADDAGLAFTLGLTALPKATHLGNRAAGRTAEAIPLLERTLADCERVRGTDHPATLTTRNNLAMAYRAAGRTAEAIPLLERTLADCERVRGADHPDTKAAREGLAALTSKPKRHRNI